jgi:pimeloyl-ACP methyl ester carboxylesterase
VIFDNRHQDTLFRYEDIDPAAVPPLHRGFVLAPWARGNGRYVGAAGQDVFQAMSEVEGRFRIDPDRRYLTGFSMGSHGAGRLAMYRPDLWAGVNLAAGFGVSSDSSRRDLRENLRGLPIQLWCGMDDARFLPPAQALFSEMTLAGFRVEARFVPDVPHTYPYPEYNRMVGALMPHRRDPQPRHFAFRTDDAAFPGRNGIDMRLPFAGRGIAAGFTCTIDGAVVSIDSEGCDGLRIDCARLGMDAQAEVTVRWNGTESYRGKPGVVTIPERFELRRSDFGLR